MSTGDCVLWGFPKDMDFLIASPMDIFPATMATMDSSSPLVCQMGTVMERLVAMEEGKALETTAGHLGVMEAPLGAMVAPLGVMEED